MRTKLQYIYSIFVFSAVLVTLYMMVNSDRGPRLAGRPIPSPALRMEATIDPTLKSLLQVEDALSELRKKPRIPSETK